MFTITLLEARTLRSPFTHLTRDGETTLCGYTIDHDNTQPGRRHCSVCWAQNGGRWR